MPPNRPRPRPVMESLAMLVGTAVSGVCAYAYIAIGTRAYGDQAMAPIAVLWTFWAVSVALFTFPIQHWAIRRISVDGHTDGVGGTAPRLAIVTVAVATVMAGGTAVAGERIFGSTSPWWPALVFLITIGAAFVGLQRGVLAGKGRYFAAAANIAAENVLRVVLGVVVAVWVDDIIVFAAVLAVGPVVAVFWPEAVRLPFRSGTREPVFVFLGGLAGGILIAQVILNAGPVVLQGIGAAEPEVTGLFLVLALFRAPYLLALGVATRLTAPLTHMVVHGADAAVRRVVLLTVAGTLAAVAIGGPLAYLAGPWVIDLVFAPTNEPASGFVALVAAGSLLALGALGLILVLIAQHRSWAVQVTWLIALFVAVLTIAVAPGDQTARVVAAFLISEAVAFTGMVVALLSRRPVTAGS